MIKDSPRSSGRVNALLRIHSQSDAHFFADHPDRSAHIRRAFRGECEGEFWSLGDHDRGRRRIILWRVPEGNPHYAELTRLSAGKVPLFKIPFLAFADESIEDDDKVLLPIVQQLMAEAAARMQ